MRHLASFLVALSCTVSAQAYTGPELQDDCLAAEGLLSRQQSNDVLYSVKSARCLNYLEGFRDGYGVGDRLATKVGVGINAFCPPQAEEERIRLVRAVLAYLDRQPPFPKGSAVPAASIVAAAFSKSFTCPE